MEKEKTLTIDDFVSGNIYHIDLEDGDEAIFMFKERHPEDNDRIFAHYDLCNVDDEPIDFENSEDESDDKKYIFSVNDSITILERTCRFATPEEREWLYACIKADELVARPIDNFSINKEQKDLKYSDFYHSQRFTGKINEKQAFGRVTIENNKIYLCQDVEDGADCQDKQGYKYSYTLSDRENTINDEDMEMVEDLKIEKPKYANTIQAHDGYIITGIQKAVKSDFISPDEILDKKQEDLKFADFYHGQKFMGNIGTLYEASRGVVTIENEKVYLCQNTTSGVICDDKQGYTHSYIIRKNKEEQNGLVKNLILQKPLQKDVEIRIKDKEYINITNLEDTNDPRIMSAFMEDLSLVGFSKINDGPIFLVKNKKLNDFDYYKNNIHTPISDAGGEINILTEEEVEEHVTI